jgi:hypothetical protein
LGDIGNIINYGMNRLFSFQRGPESNFDVVELWSTVRIPFESKGEIKGLRDSLSNSIMRIPIYSDSILHASYITDHYEYCDVENVLLYNIGPGTFKNLCQNGLCFEKKIGLIPKNPNFGIKTTHYYRYKATDFDTTFEYWNKGIPLCSWSDFDCITIKNNIKLDHFWYVMKSEEINLMGNPAPNEVFGLDLRIKAPIGAKINMAAVIKPLLDGIVSAFHVHDGSDITFLSKCIAERTGNDYRNIADFLIDPKLAILGRKTLLHRWGETIQWNPADDLFLAVKVIVNYTMERNKWEFGGDLFTLAPRI